MTPKIPLARRLAQAPAPRERAALLQMRLGSLFGELLQMSGNRDFERMQDRLLAEPFAMLWTFEDAAGDSARQ